MPMVEAAPRCPVCGSVLAPTLAWTSQLRGTIGPSLLPMAAFALDDDLRGRMKDL
jgi:hypothetical protein